MIDIRIVTATAAAAALALVSVAFGNDTPKPDNPPARIWVSSAYQPPERCRGTQHAIGYYRRAYTASRERMGLPGAVPREWYACDAARRRAAEWRDRAEVARRALDRWLYLYDWRSWLPDNWRRLGSCETGYGGDPNFEHSNGRFTSAFGISWAEYNADAAFMGAPPWHVRHTPRDQYLAALGHYKRFGDGWGCAGP